MTFLAGCAKVQVNVDEDGRGNVADKVAHVYEIEKKMFNAYMGDPSESINLELAFMDGKSDIPYISVENIKYLMEQARRNPSSPDYELSVEKDGETVTLTRETGYMLYLQFDTDVLEFLVFVGFIKSTAESTLIDAVKVPCFNEKGEPQLFQVSDTSYERYGKEVLINAGDYGIDFVHQDDGYYIPLQLVSDIIMSPYEMGLIFDGNEVYGAGGGIFDMYNDMLDPKKHPHERSEALAEFNYNELCLALDTVYGLKDQHDIVKFDDLFH